jgi:hypothetical protein
MIHQVTDSRSNPNDQIAHAVKVIGRSEHRLRVFQEVYRGKKSFKTVSALSKATKLSPVRVLQEGAKLDGNGIVHSIKINGETAYTKDKFYKTNRSKILQMVNNPSKLAKFPTKINPVNTVKTLIRDLSRKPKIQEIFIDDTDSFKSVRKVKTVAGYVRIKEKEFKRGIQKILGQPGKFQDWGGEKNDLLTTRLYLHGRRIAVAFAFKGAGMTGELTPAKMGKNGDQIQRLFESDAQILILQYWGEISERVREQMRAFATLTSLQRGETIYYCLIDGVDTARLIQAYPRQLGRAIK